MTCGGTCAASTAACRRRAEGSATWTMFDETSRTRCGACAPRRRLPSRPCSRWRSASAPTPRSFPSSTASSCGRCRFTIPTVCLPCTRRTGPADSCRRRCRPSIWTTGARSASRSKTSAAISTARDRRASTSPVAATRDGCRRCSCRPGFSRRWASRRKPAGCRARTRWCAAATTRSSCSPPGSGRASSARRRRWWDRRSRSTACRTTCWACCPSTSVSRPVTPTCSCRTRRFPTAASRASAPFVC